MLAPEMTSIRALAELVVSRYPTGLTFGEARPGDVPPAIVSPALAEKKLGWKAMTPFNVGLADLLEDESEGH